MITNFAQSTLPEQILIDYSPGSTIYDAVWQRVLKAVEEYNDPGKFTTIISYEWTSLVKGNNLHRNVLFRDGADLTAAKEGKVPSFMVYALRCL